MIRHFLAAVLAVALVGSAHAQEKAKAGGLPPGIKALKNIEYGPNERNKLDIYKPESIAAPMPLIVWIHGGGWEGGSKDNPGALAAFITKGYVCASINYRLTNGGANPHPAQIHDCKAAIRWLRAHAKEHGINPEKVGVFGASAGGHLVSLLGVTGGIKDLEGTLGNADQSSRVQAICNWFGPTDFINWTAPGVGLPGDYAKSAVGRLIGGTVDEKMDVAKSASPVTHVTKDCPPILFVHGDKDPLVPLYQSETLHGALKKKGVDTTLFVVKGGTHGGGFNAPEVGKTVVEFFERTLKK